ncbi:MAG: collagenase, partial [Psychrosphaera sp.]|nr:collagenase [Psychrosphaera sp.]
MQAVQQPAVSRILDTDAEQLWSQDFDHYQSGLLSEVADAITALAGQGRLDSEALDKLSYYLRIYSSFGPDEDWPESTANSLNRALVSLQAMPGFYAVNATNARLHENYAVALYRLYFLKPLQASIADHVKPLARLINLYGQADLPQDDSLQGKSIDYALWEVLRAGALLPYEARRKNTAEYIDAVNGEGELQLALVDFLTSPNAHRKGEDWPLQHATWALSHYYNLYNKQYWNAYYQRSEDDRKQLDEHKLSLPMEKSMDDLDNNIWAALSKGNKNPEQVKALFTVPYVVNSFRGKSECEEETLKDRCIIPTLEQALPIKHVCSNSLYIMAQSMTEAQLTKSCERLTSQESTFHHKLATEHQPAANDFNDKLRVVVFDDQAQYNRYGQLGFDIYTDNGGMYI